MWTRSRFAFRTSHSALRIPHSALGSGVELFSLLVRGVGC
jgi:hypothetical protein